MSDTSLPVVLTETVITPEDVARQMVTTTRTVVRWMAEGCPVAGRLVRLEGEMVGGRWRTSREALARFIAACREARTPPPAPPAVSPATARRRSRDDMRALKKMGVKIN